MITARIKQGLLFLFGKYHKENDILVKKVLSCDEFNIFDKMSEYDKIHSFNLYKLVKEDEILNKHSLKLALLHDCGTEHYSLIKSVKQAIIGDKQIEKHPYKSFEKLKEINLEVAELALNHHTETENIEMKKFQILDDK